MIIDKSKTVHDEVLSVALEYHQAELNLVPLALDGSKGPYRVGTTPDGTPIRYPWKQWTGERQLTPWVEQEFTSTLGIGIICGLVSGGLEVIDVDRYDAFPKLRSKLPSGFLERLGVPIVETPEGVHLYYRCEEICGSKKIARTKDGEAIVESRGEASYVVGPGSPVGVHPSGRVYVQVEGFPLPTIPVISTDDRRLIWQAARSLDEREDPYQDYVDAEIKRRRKLEFEARQQARVGDLTPWEWFDAYGDWRSILEPCGWSSRDGIRWTRPGKQSGLSAVVRAAESGNEVVVIFSTNAGDLAPTTGSHRTLGKFESLKRLRFRGDGKAAARFAMELRGANHA